MAKVIDIDTRAATSRITVAVTAQAGSAGQQVINDGNLRRVTLLNGSEKAVEYQVASGGWQLLRRGQSVSMKFDTTAPPISMRQVPNTAYPVSVDLLTEMRPQGLYADEINAVDAIAGAVSAGSAGGPLSGTYTLTALDDGKQFWCTAATTVTIPGGLTPRPSVIIDCPPAGNLTVAVSGGATINGGTASINRARAGNPGGVLIQAHADSDSYGVTGA